MSDLKSLLAVAAEQQQPVASPDFDQLVKRARRRRVLTAGGAGAAVAVAAATAALLLAPGSPSHKDTVGVTHNPSPCTAAELGEMGANWALKGLVLNGSMTVRNISAASCALAVPGVELLSARGQPLLSEGTEVPVDKIAPRSVITLAPGQAAQATLRWGGSYCGPTTADVMVKLRWPGGTTSSVPVTGPVLACVTPKPYYRRDQSSAAISGFAITTPPLPGKCCVPPPEAKLKITVRPSSGPPGTVVRISITGCGAADSQDEATVSFNNDALNTAARNDRNTVRDLGTHRGTRLELSYKIAPADRTGGLGQFFVQCGQTVLDAPFKVTR